MDLKLMPALCLRSKLILSTVPNPSASHWQLCGVATRGAMAILTEFLQVATSRIATPPAPRLVLSQSHVLSTASSIIQSYPSIASAYLFGSYAKGTARPDSDIDIALFIPNLTFDKLADIGGVQMDLEGTLDKQVDLSVCPPDDFVERVKGYWVPIDLHCGKFETQRTDSSSSSSTQSSNENQVSSCSSGISPISQSASTTTISSRLGDDPSMDSGPCAIDCGRAVQTVNEEV
jgi:predicted nucleotidyltransferase